MLVKRLLFNLVKLILLILTRIEVFAFLVPLSLQDFSNELKLVCQIINFNQALLINADQFIIRSSKFGQLVVLN
jgi:hypothetical protein